jgi:RHS repeat-associated protein
MVEQNRSGSYTEVVYSPSGAKLALMTGSSTLQKGYVPLTGGTMAVYNASGLAFYRHSDWEGSSRFASTTSRTMYFDGAYAPFGEQYATTGTTDLSYTGMQQDTVPNLYDFPARRYGSAQGRWPSPDPAGPGSVDPKNPQSWSRYAYAFNNPLGFVDTTGTFSSPVGGPESPGLCVAPFPPGDKSRLGGKGFTLHKTSFILAMESPLEPKCLYEANCLSGPNFCLVQFNSGNSPCYEYSVEYLLARGNECIPAGPVFRTNIPQTSCY